METLKACAIDLFVKPAKKEELLNAVRTAAKRDSDRLHSYAVAKRVDTLTPRERQVLALVVRGMLNKNIASGLGVREKSIEVYRSRGMKKLGVKNLSELVRMTSKLASDRQLMEKGAMGKIRYDIDGLESPTKTQTGHSTILDSD